MLKQIDIIEYDYNYYILGYDSNNKLQYLLVEPVTPSLNLESIYLCKVNKINYGNNTAFINIGGTNLTGFINLTKYNKLQDGSIIPLQVKHLGISAKQIKLDTRINFVGKYVLVSHGQFNRHVFYCDNLLKSRLVDITNKYVNYSLLFRTNIPLNIEISLIDDEIAELVNKLNALNDIILKTTTPTCLYDANPLYIGFIRDNILTTDCIVTTNSSKVLNNINNYQKNWSFNTVYQNNYNVDLDELIQMQNLTVVTTNNYTLELHNLSDINLIDINSRNANLSFFKINYLALDDIIYQIKFKDLTGIIILDLIKNMNDKQQQDILNKLNKAFATEFRNTKILGFTNAGLCEIIRKR